MKIDVNNPYEVADHDTIMRKPGYMVGYYGRVEPKKLVLEIKEKLGDYLKKAEGMFVTYYINENASMSMFFGKGQGMNVMDEIEALCNKNADTIFDIQYDNSLSLDVFEYEVLLSGISGINKKGDL